MVRNDRGMVDSLQRPSLWFCMAGHELAVQFRQFRYETPLWGLFYREDRLLSRFRQLLTSEYSNPASSFVFRIWIVHTKNSPRTFCVGVMRNMLGAEFSAVFLLIVGALHPIVVAHTQSPIALYSALTQLFSRYGFEFHWCREQNPPRSSVCPVYWPRYGFSYDHFSTFPITSTLVSQRIKNIF